MDYQEHNYASSELEYKHFLSPSLNETMAGLNLKEGAVVLDAGCGPGATFQYLASLGRNISLTGLDGSKSHLEAAKHAADQLNLTSPIDLIQLNLFDPLPFPDEKFDLIWISDVLFPDDTGEATLVILKELKRVLKKGGQLVIFYGNWLRFTLLPGYSLLENSIHVANELSKSRDQAWTSWLHPEKSAFWLHQLGFEEIDFRTTPTQYRAPLEPRIKHYIHWHIDHIYRKAILFNSDQHQFDPELRSLFERITNPEDDDYLLNDPGYWCEASPIVAKATRSYKST